MAAPEKLFFSCTALAGLNKKGVLKKNADGRYRIVLGALNMFNTRGDYYPYEPVKELFDKSSKNSIMRRIEKGRMKSEEGHPKWLPGMTPQQYADRLYEIYEDRVCSIIHDFELDFNRISDHLGRPVVAVIGHVCGSGPFGAALEKSMEDPGEDVCYSIRAVSDNVMIGGVLHRLLRDPVTYDRVTECGIPVASKFTSPALESAGNSRIWVPEQRLLTDVEIGMDELVLAAEAKQREVEAMGMAMESNLFMGVKNLFKAFNWDAQQRHLPDLLQWAQQAD